MSTITAANSLPHVEGVDASIAGRGAWYLDLRFYFGGILSILALSVSWISYQRTFAYAYGMDSVDPVFDQYWTSLLYGNLAGAVVLSVALWGWLWWTRDRQLAALDPKVELRRWFYLGLWLSAYTFAVYWAASFFAEQDGAWHQVIIRDTSFTPSHIVMFYGAFPLYIILGIATYLYASTRIPVYNKGVSFPLLGAVAGPFLALPNVGFNEWGHAFWFMEELFSAPLHWGFAIFGWTGLFIGGLLVQFMTHISNLVDVIWLGEDKRVLQQI